MDDSDITADVAKACGVTEAGLRFLIACERGPHGFYFGATAPSAAAGALARKDLIINRNESVISHERRYQITDQGREVLVKARAMGWTG